jgi:hypothetical protein
VFEFYFLGEPRFITVDDRLPMKSYYNTLVP